MQMNPMRHTTAGLTMIELLISAGILLMVVLVAGRAGVWLGASQTQNAQQNGLHMAMNELLAQYPPEFENPRTLSGNLNSLGGFNRLPPRTRTDLAAGTFTVTITNTTASYRVRGAGELGVEFQALAGSVVPF